MQSIKSNIPKSFCESTNTTLTRQQNRHTSRQSNSDPRSIDLARVRVERELDDGEARDEVLAVRVILVRDDADVGGAGEARGHLRLARADLGVDVVEAVNPDRVQRALCALEIDSERDRLAGLRRAVGHLEGGEVDQREGGVRVRAVVDIGA